MNTESKPDMEITIDLKNLKIETVTEVDDAAVYNPRDPLLYDMDNIDWNSEKSGHLRYDDREHLLWIPQSTREKIHDVRVLKKLNDNELTEQQKQDLERANTPAVGMDRNNVEVVLTELKKEDFYFVDWFPGGTCFRKTIHDQGGHLSHDAIGEILQGLTYDALKEATVSCLEFNWISLLMVFRYNHMFTCPPWHSYTAVTVDPFDVKVKADIDCDTNTGHAAISFHVVNKA